MVFFLACESIQNGGNLGARKGIRSAKQKDPKDNLFLYICEWNVQGSLICCNWTQSNKEKEKRLK